MSQNIFINMNIRKIIKEELDDFKWIRDVNLQAPIESGQEIIVNNLGDEESFISWLGDYAGEYLEGKYGNPIKGVIWDFAYHGETFSIYEENTGDELWFPTDKHKLVKGGYLNLFYEAVN